MDWTGGCLCGEVRFVARGTPHFIRHCHCKMCQRASGSAFMTGLAFRLSSIEWLKGERIFYESSPGFSRSFCATCGSSMSHEGDGKVWLYLGSLDEPEKLPVNELGGVDADHVFASGQIPWINIEDDLPRHAEMPPGGRLKI